VKAAGKIRGKKETHLGTLKKGKQSLRGTRLGKPTKGSEKGQKTGAIKGRMFRIHES